MFCPTSGALLRSMGPGRAVRQAASTNGHRLLRAHGGVGIRDEGFEYRSHVERTRPDTVALDVAAGVTYVRSAQGGGAESVSQWGLLRWAQRVQPGRRGPRAGRGDRVSTGCRPAAIRTTRTPDRRWHRSSARAGAVRGRDGGILGRPSSVPAGRSTTPGWAMSGGVRRRAALVLRPLVRAAPGRLRRSVARMLGFVEGSYR